MAEVDCISLSVLSPEKTVLKKSVSKVELPGEKGRFMVLKNHAPLISSLTEGRVVYMSGGQLGQVNILSGFVEINENEVTVCAEVEL